MELTTLVLIGIGVLVALYLGHAGFRQLVRVRTDKAIDAGTTAIEKQEDEYKRLRSQLTRQREAVTTVMARSRQSEKDLTAARAAVDAAENDYNMAEDMKASDETLDALATKWDDAKKNVDELATIATELKGAQEEAQEALADTIKSLEKFARQIEQDKAKDELTDALNISADARRQARSMNSEISKAREASRQVDLELEKARANNELSRGSKTDREMEDIREKAAAKSARDALRARREAKSEGNG